MPVSARRVFRLALTVALALAAGYGLGLSLPFLAPLFALLLTAAPGAPMGPKSLLGLVLVLLITLGTGLLLAPLLQHYPVTAVLVAAVGIYLGTYLTVNLGKGLVGLLLTLGVTLISAAGLVSSALSSAVILALAGSIIIAVVCHWLVYPWFPEDSVAPPAQRPTPVAETNWIALRATLIVLPAYLLALTNPGLYLPIIMKSVALGQQTSLVSMRHAGSELLGSTFAGGLAAIGFWFLLSLSVNLWMFFLWTLLFGVVFAVRFYGVAQSRYAPSFWQNVFVTMLILLGSAVQDSANGKDVYQAFAVRMSLFLGVTAYAWVALAALEAYRARRISWWRGDRARPAARPRES